MNMKSSITIIFGMTLIPVKPLMFDKLKPFSCSYDVRILLMLKCVKSAPRIKF